MTGCICCGVDPSQAMLAEAGTSHPTLRLKAGRGEALPYPAAEFDLAFAVDVIHHVADRAQFYREAYRVLRPSGLVCTTTDTEATIPRRTPLSAYFPATVAPELMRYPTLAQVVADMEQTGFTDIRHQLVEHDWLLTDASAYRAKTFSCLHLIPDVAFERGIAALERDLANGPVACVSRYVMVWGRRE